MEPLGLYRLLISQLDEAPDLTHVQKPAPCPEGWPLFLMGVQYERNRASGFWVADAEGRKCMCVASVNDVYDKIAVLGAGAIIHLKGAHPKFNAAQNAYVLDVATVLTLKEYDADLQRETRRRQKREARLQAEMALEGLVTQDVDA
jgi:hypothetical protein